MPRAFDRLTPPVDKDPNRFGTDYNDPFGAITEGAAAAGEQIRNNLITIIRDLTGIDLTGPAEFVDWLSNEIGVALYDLASTLTTLLQPVIDAIEDILELIYTTTGIDIRSVDGFFVWLTGLIGLDLRNLKATLDSIAGAVGQTIDDILDGIKALLGLDLRALANLNPVQLLTDLAANVSQLMTWFGNVTAEIAAAVSAALDNIVAKIKDLTGLDLAALAALNPVGLLTQIMESLAGIVLGPNSVTNYISTAIQAAITNLLNGTALRDQVNSLVNAANAAFQTATQVAAAIQTAITNLLNGTDLQNRVNTLVDAATAAFQTAAQVTTAINTAITNFTNGVFKTLQDLVQALIDGIKNISFPGLVLGAGAQGAVDIINAIFGLSGQANTSASNAHAEIEAIKAANAAGFSDVFEIPNAPALVAPWVKKSTLADGYGPDGNGAAVGKISGNSVGLVHYVNTTAVPSADMKVTATLSRSPWWDLTTKAAWFLMVQANATDKACFGVEIKNTTCTFFQMNAAGTMTTVGVADRPIAANATGVPYTLQIKGTSLSLYRNNIVQHTFPVTAPLTGRLIGFGCNKPSYINLAGDNPLAQFAGISWQPA